MTDFGSMYEKHSWYVLNDSLMGGRSEGAFTAEKGQLIFAGRTNADEGGFSSIRTDGMHITLSRFAGIRLRVLGDGRQYTWRMTTTAKHQGQPIAYWATFETRKGVWATVDLPFADFVPRFRGLPIDGPPFDANNITGMGLMIYDKQDGPFEVRLDSMGVYAYVHKEPSMRCWAKLLHPLSSDRARSNPFSL